MVLINYDHKPFETENTLLAIMAFNPQFPFGEGLSYTTFTYSDLRFGNKRFPQTKNYLSVSPLQIAASCAARKPCCFTSAIWSRRSRRRTNELRRFAKISLEPGQSRTLTFKLRREDLSFIGADNK